MAGESPKDSKDPKSLVSSVLGGLKHQTSQDSPQSSPGDATPGAPETSDDAPLPPGDALDGGTPDVAAARSLLDKLGVDEGGGLQEPAPAPVPPESEEEASVLIDLYFELEEPEERDALFERLALSDLGLVTDFFRTMLDEDEDDEMRAAAAAELARRGVAEGVEALEAYLDDPEEPWQFETAAKSLGEIRGVGFYDTLRVIWESADRDGDVRREAMLALEWLDLDRALGDFLALVEGVTDIDTMPDDQVEVAMLAFVRHGRTDALPALEALRSRVKAAPIDVEEKRDLVEFVTEGIDLLRGE